MNLRTVRHRIPRPLELLDRGLDLMLPTSSNDLLRSANETGPVVALSFDDGPSAHNTPRILDLLKEHDAHATFFVVGERMDGQGDLLRRMTHLGHELGNHTFSHQHTRYLNRAELRAEVEATNRAIEPYYPDVRLVRPPFGKDRRRTVSVARELGMRVALWSVDSGDAMGRSTREVVAQVLENAQPGGIILFHDGGNLRPVTVEACAQIVPALRETGLLLVSISELIARREPQTALSVSARERQPSS